MSNTPIPNCIFLFFLLYGFYTLVFLLRSANERMKKSNVPAMIRDPGESVEIHVYVSCARGRSFVGARGSRAGGWPSRVRGPGAVRDPPRLLLLVAGLPAGVVFGSWRLTN